MTSINRREFWEQVSLGEDSKLEFKAVKFRGANASAPRRESLADEIAAFGNARGGRLILGVTDDGQPQTLTRLQLDILGRLVDEICTDSIKPSMDYEVIRIPVESGEGGVLLVEIPESKTVHRSPGGYYYRKGASKRVIEHNEVSRLSQMRGQSDAVFFDTQVVRESGINSLQRELWRKYVSSRGRDSDEVALSKLKFIKIGSQEELLATVGGILLASEDPSEWLPNAWIQAVSYRGKKMGAKFQLDARDIKGPLDEQIRAAVRFVAANQRVAAYKNPARIDLPQFSLEAVFEAIVNAVVHRDYSVRGSRIRLFLFEDRLELYSPGGLCNSMTTEDLRTTQFTRNELLASRLGQCRVGDVPGSGGREYFLEKRGEGISVIEDETFAFSGQPPVFELFGGRELRLILPSAELPDPEGILAQIVVSQSEDDTPLQGVNVLMLYPNNTYLEAHTDSRGRVEFVIHSKLPMTVFCAVDGYFAHVERGYIPGKRLDISMRPCQGGGSRIIADHAGHLPGVQARLYPTIDNHDRTYLYADSAVINEGESPPVQFELDEPVRLKDVHGVRVVLWFREMLGASCVFDYAYEAG
ncbi:MAG: transcriptional regulator [Rhodothermaceae bacterium]|nr:transcriptional regulator [Rhodothermaceae bacterium]MXW32376.1 transcriptional regulator [Rhodothermaceae bacterium]MXZ17380.1 transcriptional regulator [Rhodothermaceae bacterium]MYC03305.1 transcriptional regulator [Rhodothermaceae bacterium]MYE63754.1 transcriptional regulator [Rhodothermaceae bacterium]